jgi:hypothetical protein
MMAHHVAWDADSGAPADKARQLLISISINADGPTICRRADGSRTMKGGRGPALPEMVAIFVRPATLRRVSVKLRA